MACWAVAAALLSRDATADDRASKQACVEVHERAQRLRHDGLLVAARDQLAACSDSACPALVRADCAQWLNEVDDILPTIVLGAHDASGADVADVRVTCDGREIAGRLDGRAVAVDPGEHVFHFERAASRPVDARIVVREGERARALVAQFEAPAPRPTRFAGPAAVTYVVGGAAVVALGSFAFFGIRGLSREGELSSSCSPHCTDTQAHGARTDLVAADISLAAGVALGAVATFLFFTTRKPDVVATPVPMNLDLGRDVAGQRRVGLVWSTRLP